MSKSDITPLGVLDCSRAIFLFNLFVYFFWLVQRDPFFNSELFFAATFPCHQHYTLVSQVHQLWILPQLFFLFLLLFGCPIFPLPNTVSETNSCTLYLCVLPVLLTVCHAAPVVTRCFQTAFSIETENISRGEKYPKNMVPVTYVTYLPPKDYW